MAVTRDERAGALCSLLRELHGRLAALAPDVGAVGLLFGPDRPSFQVYMLDVLQASSDLDQALSAMEARLLEGGPPPRGP